MKSNFEFLKEYWPALAQIGLFAERLVQEILVFEGIVEPQKDNTHANRIRLLKRSVHFHRSLFYGSPVV